MGWGGIIINVVVALKKSVRRCGCFEEPCSTSRALCVVQPWVGLLRFVVTCKQR